MADKLQFDLVSPERELMSKEVDQVDIPGTEGIMGVLLLLSGLLLASGWYLRRIAKQERKAWNVRRSC